LAELFLKAGFTTVKEDRISRKIHFLDADDYFELFLKGTPLGHSLSEEEESIQKEVLRKTRLNLEKWRNADGLEVPGEVVIVSAHK